MTAQFFFGALLCALILFNGVYLIFLLKIKRNKWLKSLKPGDKILVRIYSKTCECVCEATVTKALERDFINATLDEVNRKNCESCSKLKGEDCWYDVTRFYKNNIKPIK